MNAGSDESYNLHSGHQRQTEKSTHSSQQHHQAETLSNFNTGIKCMKIFNDIENGIVHCRTENMSKSIQCTHMCWKFQGNFICTFDC